MKTINLKKITSLSGVALALGLVGAFPVQSQATEPMRGGMMMDGPKSEMQQAMQQRHQALMAEMKVQDDELTALVAKMNAAAKDKKVDLLASIVTRMVEQRASMNQRMMKMHGEMMMPNATGNEKKSMPTMHEGMMPKKAKPEKMPMSPETMEPKSETEPMEMK